MKHGGVNLMRKQKGTWFKILKRRKKENNTGKNSLNQTLTNIYILGLNLFSLISLYLKDIIKYVVNKYKYEIVNLSSKYAISLISPLL